MKYYHMEFANIWDDPIQKFVPRVPQSRLDEEDDTVPRVCVARSIEDCVKGIPGEIGALCRGQKGAFSTALFGEGKAFLRVYEFDSDNYVTEGPKPSFWDSTELSEMELVPDAKETGECWLAETFSIEPNNVKYLCVDKAVGREIVAMHEVSRNEFEVTNELMFEMPKELVNVILKPDNLKLVRQYLGSYDTAVFNFNGPRSGDYGYDEKYCENTVNEVLFPSCRKGPSDLQVSCLLTFSQPIILADDSYKDRLSDWLLYAVMTVDKLYPVRKDILVAERNKILPDENEAFLQVIECMESEGYKILSIGEDQAEGRGSKGMEFIMGSGHDAEYVVFDDIDDGIEFCNWLGAEISGREPEQGR